MQLMLECFRNSNLEIYLKPY